MDKYTMIVTYLWWDKAYHINVGICKILET